METELIIEGVGFPPLSARGCRQELNLVEQGEFRRTVNGTLIYLGPEHQKYRSMIWCEDKVTLVSEGVLERGAVLRIGCLQRLWQKSQKMDVTLERDAVDGSVVVMDTRQKTQRHVMKDQRRIEIILVEREREVPDQCHSVSS